MRKVRVNMENVESFSRCPEGEWVARLKKIEEATSQGSGDDYLKAQFEVIQNGEAKGDIVFENFSLNEKALWKLKSFLVATGSPSTGKLVLDLDKLEGKVCIITVVHDEYNGKKRAKISEYNKYVEPEEDTDDDDEDEDEKEEVKAKSSTKTKKAAKPKAEPEEDEDDDWEDEEEEPAPKAKKTARKSSTKTTKKTAKKAKEPEPEEDDEDDWEEDED